MTKPMLEKGTVLNDKWEILAHLATGGKGEVYRARQKNLDREVAIKIISPDFIESLEDDEEDLEAELARFKREVLVMAQTRHPNILQIFDYDKTVVDDREFEYIAMEYIPGATLRLTMPADGFGNDENGFREWVSSYFFPLLDGVEAIHRLGIVHRDLKPENVLLDNEIPKIADFGLAGAKFMEPITRSHHALGTIIYMAPEQFSDMDLTDARADVYALGKILYEAVSGKMGKGTAFPLQTVSLGDPDTPYLKHLDQIIQQATAKDPSQRIPSAKEFKHILERFLTEPSSATPRIAGAAEPPSSEKTRKIWPTTLIVILAGLLLAGVWYHFQGLPGMTKPESPTERSSEAPRTTTTEPPDLASVPRTSGAKYISRDGATLRFIPGGEFHLIDNASDESEKPIVVAPFFMEENEVTNHQYVEFLNEQMSRIKIENDVVKGDGEIWLLLGEVRDGYEPIRFKAGMFVVNGPEHASFPVVRVTAFGAVAYAKYYGRRLPTVNEWLHAAQTRHLETDISAKGAGQPADNSISEDTHAMMHQQPSLPKGFDTSPSAIGETPANKFSIIGLNANVSEWVAESSKSNGETQYYVMGGLGEERADPTSRAVGRHPWEAFGTVGFRTVVPLDR